MRVFLVTRELLDYSVEYANAISHFCKVSLCVPPSTFGSRKDYVNKSVDLCLHEWPRHRSLKNISLIYKLVGTIKEHNPDIIHFLSPDAVWLNAIFPFIKSIPVITTVHDINYHPGDMSSKKIPEFLRNSFIRKSKLIFVHGGKLKKQAREYFKFEDSRVQVIHHVARFRYQEMVSENHITKKEDGTFKILFFGRIFEYKGLRYLIQSESLVRKSVPNAKFVIAGEGEEFSKYSDLISDLVHFDIRNRRIPDLEVAQLFTDADIVTLPYVEASQSGVIPISMTFGKPVIVTDVGSLAETVGEGNMGLIIPPRDSERLAEAIIRLAQDLALRQKMGKNALEMAHSIRSPKAIGKKAFDIYQSVG